ncbi:MAG: hypothetical protein HYV63_26425 [Candidatus Schekmanbacteria bacterium]|nr:hypothetical protein [Candidatus Schekmanbacteria bacterium]
MPRRDDQNPGSGRQCRSLPRPVAVAANRVALLAEAASPNAVLAAAVARRADGMILATGRVRETLVLTTRAGTLTARTPEAATAVLLVSALARGLLDRLAAHSRCNGSLAIRPLKEVLP